MKQQRVHLGCFVDDPVDMAYMDDLKNMCASVFAARLRPAIARIKSLSGLLSRKPLSVPYYFDAKLADWIKQTLAANEIDTIVAYSSPMGQYLQGKSLRRYQRVADFVDVDSDKWRQYQFKAKWPMRWIYAREARLLAQFEKNCASEFDAIVFVTQNEVDLFKEISSAAASKYYAVPNGVAIDYFDPSLSFDSPYDDDAAAIVFTGVMDYWPNVDAVCWFARDVFPKIRENNRAAQFWIVGTSPTKQVTGLEAIEGIRVTGRVPDVRPYLKHAKFAVAPLRIARGIQNKVLEALAMGRQVLCTAEAASGLLQPASMPVMVANSVNEMVSMAENLLGSARNADLGEPPRSYVKANYDWNTNLSIIDQIVRPEPSLRRDNETEVSSVR